MLLEHTTSPADVKQLAPHDLPVLCREIRQAILTSSAAVGGHVGSNLGTVELTVALHRVFDSPHDKLVFDVSHQTYTHKMLTGRAPYYLQPELFGTLSGFSNPAESEHDLFSMGHTSTSVSLAAGLAKARDLAGDDYNVVAVIGDGSLSGGLAFEGLDSLAELGTNVIVIINDNGWSIAENHGGIYRNLAALRENGGMAPDNFFRALGLDYRFIADGNDEAVLERELLAVRDIDHPVVLHVCTVKGEGYEAALDDAENWHHVSPFDQANPDSKAQNNVSPATYADLTGRHLLERMSEDRNVVVISAATPYIMGFDAKRRQAAGSQFIDVGIAEEHAVTLTTGLATAGAKPVLGLYGVFMQRAYDELWHDLCLNDVCATILDFSASAFGATDATHLGFFDLALMGGLPNLSCLAPTCQEEYLAMLDWALDAPHGPVVIRVPAGAPSSHPERITGSMDFAQPTYQTVRTGSGLAILALGNFLELGERVADALAARGVHATVINPRFATELDTNALDGLGRAHRAVITLEDGVLAGGWGEKVARYLAPTNLRIRCYGYPKAFPDRVKPLDLLRSCGITVTDIVRDALELLER